MRLAHIAAAFSALFLAELLYGPLGPDPWAIQEIRLPRAVGAACSGALMALSGLVLQTLLRNELADPYILGVPQTAALGGTATLVAAIALGLPYTGYVAGAVAGAAASSTAIILLSSRLSPAQVIIAGVLIGFTAVSVEQILIASLPPEIAGMLVIGSTATFAAFDKAHAAVAAATLASTVSALALLGRRLSAMAFGEQAAAGFGVDVRAARVAGIAIASASVAVVVVSAGPISFIGLVAPFLARATTGSYRLDAAMGHAAAWGAVTALAADLVVRAAPGNIPLNAPLSLVGTAVAARILTRRLV